MIVWMDIASHLHMPIQRCMRSHTSTEFVRWKVWLEMQWNRHTKMDHYLARIAREVSAARAKNPMSVRIKDFLMKFVFKKKDDDQEVTPESTASHIQNSKNAWFAIAGYTPDGNKE